MKLKMKQFFQLILILYFSNTWEINAVYNDVKPDESQVKLRTHNVIEKSHLRSLMQNIQKKNEIEKDGVYVKELINNELILENL